MLKESGRKGGFFYKKSEDTISKETKRRTEIMSIYVEMYSI